MKLTAQILPYKNTPMTLGAMLKQFPKQYEAIDIRDSAVIVKLGPRESTFEYFWLAYRDDDVALYAGLFSLSSLLKFDDLNQPVKDLEYRNKSINEWATAKTIKDFIAIVKTAITKLDIEPWLSWSYDNYRDENNIHDDLKLLKQIERALETYGVRVVRAPR